MQSKTDLNLAHGFVQYRIFARSDSGWKFTTKHSNMASVVDSAYVSQ